MSDYTVEITLRRDEREVVRVSQQFNAHDDARALAGMRGWVETLLHRTNWHSAANEKPGGETAR